MVGWKFHLVVGLAIIAASCIIGFCVVDPATKAKKHVLEKHPNVLISTSVAKK